MYIIGEKNTYKYNIGVEYYTIAEEYEKLKNYDKAITYYKKCLEFDVKTKNELIYKIAQNSALNKSWDDAIKYYKILLEQDPDNRIIKKSIAYIYASNDNLLMSIKMYAELYKNDIYDQECVENYIYVLIANKDMNTANIILEEYKINFPDSTKIETLAELINNTNEKNIDLEDTNSENLLN